MSDGSHALVDIECDGCGKLLINVKWQRYKKYQKEDGKYYCQGCSKILFNKIKYIETACTGIGKYKPWVNGVITTQYNAWRNMLMRCYDEKNFLKQPTYEDCTVCEEWHNFQNFAKWYDDNYYEVEGNSTQIYKPLLTELLVSNLFIFCGTKQQVSGEYILLPFTNISLSICVLFPSTS